MIPGGGGVCHNSSFADASGSCISIFVADFSVVSGLLSDENDFFVQSNPSFKSTVKIEQR